MGAELVNRYLSEMRADRRSNRGARRHVDVARKGPPRFPGDPDIHDEDNPDLLPDLLILNRRRSCQSMLTPNQRRRNSLGQDCSTILSYPQRRDSVWTPQGIAVQNLRGNLHPRPGTPVLVPEAPADASGRSATVSLGEVSADVGMRGYSASAPSGAVRTGSEVGAVPLSL
jgi:hypothetical protein